MTCTAGGELLDDSPVTLRRRVAWGECDPAGVVYTPVFSEYAVSAFQAFLACVLGDPLQEQLRSMDVQVPVRALSFDFQRSLRPDQCFDLAIWLCEIRGTTFATQVVASESGKVTRSVAYCGCTRVTKRPTSGISFNRSSKWRASSSVRESSSPRGREISMEM